MTTSKGSGVARFCGREAQVRPFKRFLLELEEDFLHTPGGRRSTLFDGGRNRDKLPNWRGFRLFSARPGPGKALGEKK